MNKQLTAIVIGFGNRGGDVYSHFAATHPEELKIVAMADPREGRRLAAQKQNGVAPEMCFETGEELLALPKMADICIVTTQDRQHVGHALAAIEKGYHILCEKPISPDLEQCLLLQKAAHDHKRFVAIGHVLRFTPFYSTIKALVDSGRIGDVVNIQAMEHVRWYHQAHSYVRGNWRSTEETSPMIMAKCCHDLDIFAWLLNKPCERVSSYGSLHLFKPEMAPEGAALRCLDGCACKDTCPYDAEKIYVTSKETGILQAIADGRQGHDCWPVSVISPDDLTEEGVYKALREGPYGRCVYHCDNDAVDHQVVNMEFEGGATVNFTMTAFTAFGSRTIMISGTNGEIKGDILDGIVTITEYGKESEVIDTNNGDMSGHGGGDNRLIHDFLESLSDEADEASLRTGIDVSIQSHVIALAAEYSRIHKGESVEISEFAKL